MDGLHPAPPPDEDDPLHGWRINTNLLTMLHLDNGMSFASIALLIAEGTGADVTAGEVKAACIAVGIVAAPAQRPIAADKPVRQGRRARAAVAQAVGPHEPVGCRWIDGDPKGVWHFCQAGQKAGSSYCQHHHQLSRISLRIARQMEVRAAEARRQRDAASEAIKVR